jgi:small GTP-binding protein
MNNFSKKDRIVAHENWEVYSIAWRPDGRMLASGSNDGTIKLWTWPRPSHLVTLNAHSAEINGLAWSPGGQELVSSSDDFTLRIWGSSGQPLQTLEGHTGPVYDAAFSPCGRLLASRGRDDGIWLWRCDTWQPVARIDEPETFWTTGSIAFHPTLPRLATTSFGNIHIWALDVDMLLGATPASQSVLYTTAKVVLVGDSGVGKTGLGWRLAHGEFKEQTSTHGQQFWVLDSLRATRDDGAECEAVLWDLAGQPDYRLLHALFLDDAELALVLFDPTDYSEPLRGAEYWIKALANRPGGPCPIILVAARIDRGQPTLTKEEIVAFCRDRGVSGGYLSTSALTGVGLDELVDRMRVEVAWERRPTTVTTITFKRIKEFVLGLKEADRVILDSQALRRRLEESDPTWKFSDDELATAVGHLAKHGYVQILRTAAGERSILLRPDLLNQLASSIVLEARRNPKGLGAVDEVMLRGGHYAFPELDGLETREREVLLDAAVVLFVEHNLCFRESVGSQTLLIFPELINRKRPPTEGAALVDDVSYTIKGAVANVYAALVVLLGYTNTFTRTEQWQAQAQYEVDAGEICGFRQVGEREGELDLVLAYGATVSSSTRLLFQGLFERVLLGRRVSVTLYPPMDCPQCYYRQERSEVVRRTVKGHEFLFCSNCGTKIMIPPAEGASLRVEATDAVDKQAATAVWRTQYETALAQLGGFIRTWEHEPKRVFVSYAWGVTEHEDWVERRLARDLRHAGIDVVLDRWDNARPGANVARFVSRISECELVVVVGTPLYRRKYENKVSDTGSVVAAEVDLIDQRLLGTEDEKRSVLPVLLDGDDRISLPPLLQRRVYVDFRRPESYFASLFDLVLAIQGIRFDDEAVIDLRQFLRQGPKRSGVK